ncbi:MAG: transposon-encoded TnpW family protein [Clostridia bacterium]|nr:transposon-encoded TnpW family protein [Clostridia bacterium]
MKVVLPRYNGLLIDGEWYVVENVFSRAAKETLEDKLKRLIIDNIPTKNAVECSQKPNN